MICWASKNEHDSHVTLAVSLIFNDVVLLSGMLCLDDAQLRRSSVLALISLAASCWSPQGRPCAQGAWAPPSTTLTSGGPPPASKGP